MALSNKLLSPTCVLAHGDIATYFFFEKIFRSDGEMCVSVTSSQKISQKIAPKNGVIETHIPPSDRNIFSKQKYVATSSRPGAHVSEMNLLLSAIRRSYRQNTAVLVGIKFWRVFLVLARQRAKSALGSFPKPNPGCGGPTRPQGPPRAR